MRSTQSVCVGLGCLVFLAGCPPEELVCTDLAAVSVTVTVVDAAGAVVPDASVTFAANGGASQPCDASFEEGSFVCGYEVAGEIVVTASAPGRVDDSETVVVEMDDVGCHVVGQSVSLMLVDE